MGGVNRQTYQMAARLWCRSRLWAGMALGLLVGGFGATAAADIASGGLVGNGVCMSIIGLVILAILILFAVAARSADVAYSLAKASGDSRLARTVLGLGFDD